MAQNNTTLSSSPVVAFAGTAIAADLWFAAIIAIPGFQSSGLALSITRIAVQIIVLVGAWIALSRTSLTASERRSTWLTISIFLTVWHVGAWVIVARGFLLPGAVRVPLLPVMIVVPTAIVITLVLRSRRIGLLLDAMPANWLIGLKAYRVIGGVFFINWMAGASPAAFAIPTGTGDVITGLTALPTAIILASGRLGSTRAAVLWNFFGMADLVLAVTMGPLLRLGRFNTSPSITPI